MSAAATGIATSIATGTIIFIGAGIVTGTIVGIVAKTQAKLCCLGRG
jgi:hypothetical protein